MFGINRLHDVVGSAGCHGALRAGATGPDLQEGMQVIAGLNTATSGERQETTNPFQQRRGFGGPPTVFRVPGGGG